jgi:hypothetical protein
LLINLTNLANNKLAYGPSFYCINNQGVKTE